MENKGQAINHPTSARQAPTNNAGPQGGGNNHPQGGQPRR